MRLGAGLAGGAIPETDHETNVGGAVRTETIPMASGARPTTHPLPPREGRARGGGRMPSLAPIFPPPPAPARQGLGGQGARCAPKQSIWRAGRDPAINTNPLRFDTDDDGLADGDEDANHNGRVDSGESTPGSMGNVFGETPELLTNPLVAFSGRQQPAV